MTWLEKAAADPSLRAFIDAETARACVDLQALRVENAHQRQVIASQASRLKAFEAEQKTATPKQRALKGNAVEA